MENYLLDLLEYRDVLAVVATTADGLIVATAGLNGDDAEVLGRPGRLWRSTWSSRASDTGASPCRGECSTCSSATN